MAPGYYTTQQAVRKRGITRAALHQWIKKGHVKAPRLTVGRALIWKRSRDRPARRGAEAHPPDQRRPATQGKAVIGDYPVTEGNLAQLLMNSLQSLIEFLAVVYYFR